MRQEGAGGNLGLKEIEEFNEDSGGPKGIARTGRWKEGFGITAFCPCRLQFYIHGVSGLQPCASLDAEESHGEDDV